MRAALERAGAQALPAAASDSGAVVWLPLALASALAALVAAAVFAGGGSGDEAMPWVGGGALLLALVAVGAALAGAIPGPRLTRAGLAGVGLFGAFVLWNGVTIAWSIAPDRSWSYFNRGLVYFAFLLAGLILGALLPRAPSLAAGALAVVVAGALVYALAGKLVPALYLDGGRIARLRAPVGYWNGLALLLALGLPLALWLGGLGGRRHALRAGAAVFLFALSVAILLTYSRGGILVGALALVAWLALSPRRLEALALLLAAVPPAGGLAFWAFRQPGLADDGQDLPARADAGAALALALVLGALLVWAAVFAGSRLAARRSPAPTPRLRPSRRLGAALAGIAAVATFALALTLADPAGWAEARLEEFQNPPDAGLVQESSRLTSVSSNHRWTWWKEAWGTFLDNPVTGTGAGSFVISHRLVRENPIYVTEPHNVPLQFLSETGLVGAVLAGAGTLAGLVAVVQAVRRTGVRERAAATALAIGFGAYLLHSLIDWDWDFLALNAPVFAAVGVLLASGKRPVLRPRGRWLLALAPAAVAVTGLVSLLSPWLAERRIDEAYMALGRGDGAEALESADRAVSLNPLAVGPLRARASAQTALGRLDAARRTLEDAVRVQPLNSDTWYELGSFELQVAERPEAASRYLSRARELDPYGPAGPLLDALESSRAGG